MNTDFPLYKQIIIELENSILAGIFLPGCRIPSVRALAAQYQVTTNTIQKTIRGLKQEGILVSDKGGGTSVTDDTDVIGTFRKKRGEERIRWFLRQMEKLGYSREQVKMMVVSLIHDEQHNSQM